MEHNLTITYEDIILEPLTLEYAMKYKELRNREENRKWFVYNKEISDEQQKSWYAEYLCNKNDIMFAILNSNKEFIGCNAIYNINNEERTAEYGRLLVDYNKYHGGYGYKATMAALKIAFDMLEVQEIRLEVFKNNMYAIPIYEKCGFVVNDKKLLDDDMIEMDLEVRKYNNEHK